MLKSILLHIIAGNQGKSAVGHLEVSELPDDGLMKQEPDVLLVIKGLDLGHVTLLGPFPVPRLSRMDALENT